MSRVHCIDCGSAVIVDPTGLCPDGHHVGAAGARVAGAMGSAGRPHADEPEPWVAQVILDDDPTPVAATPRRARPVSVPGVEPADEADTDQESLLQELHALAEFGFDDLGGGNGSSAGASPSPARAAGPNAAPGSETRPPSANGSGVASAATSSTDAVASPTSEPARGDDLAALEAALHELSLPDDAPATPARTNGTAHRGETAAGDQDGLAGLEGLAELDDLFGSAPARPSPAAEHVTPVSPPPTTAPPAAADPAPAPFDPASAHRDPTSAHRDPVSAHLDPAPAHRDPTSTHRDPTPAPIDPPPAPTSAPESPAAAADAPAPANLDITNFTAKGGRVGGRKRRFGR